MKTFICLRIYICVYICISENMSTTTRTIFMCGYIISSILVTKTLGQLKLGTQTVNCRHTFTCLINGVDWIRLSLYIYYQS